MTTPIDTAGQEPRQIEVPQDSLWRILFMFLWPAIWYTFVIYGIAPRFIPEDIRLPTWLFLSVIVLGSGAELFAGLILLKQEGYQLNIDALRERILLRWPKGKRAWVLAFSVLFLALVGSILMGPLHVALANTPGFVPPEWFPTALDPRTEITSASDVFPDIALKGNILFVLIYFVIGLVFNIFGEEIYYRGYLLPRMHGAFGRWAWVANGVLFTLKHVYQRWLYPGILIGGLAFAFAAGPLGSLPLAMLFHWIGNFLIAMILLILAAFGMG